MANAIIDFNLEDIANFITYNDSGDREGYGILEVGNLITETVCRFGISDESPEWDKMWRVVHETVSNSFRIGMQAGAQLQVQLLTGGKS